MDETQQKVETPKSGGNNNMMLIIVVVVALLVIGGAFYYYHKHSHTSAMQTAQVAPTSAMPENPTASSSPTIVMNDVYTVKTNATKGQYLTDPKGMTLYTYDKDTIGKSNCEDGCLKAWPAYVATAAASQLPANISFITRSEGTKQYAWKGMPLYYFASDQKMGDTLGDGVAGVWHIVKP